MSQPITRVRWNAEERAALMTEIASLRSTQPTRSIADLFRDAQLKLPSARRRKFGPAIKAWLDREFETFARMHAQIASPPAAAEPALPAAGGPDDPPLGDESLAGIAPAALQPAIAAVLAELGSQVAVSVLRDPRVHEALREAMLAVSRAARRDDGPGAAMAVDAAPDDGVSADAAPRAEGKLRVLIAGIEPAQSATFSKTYEDRLDLHCWTADQGLEVLRQIADQADVVIGMTGQLSQPVERTLRHHARRYINHSRGIPGLRSELASLALQGG